MEANKPLVFSFICRSKALKREWDGSIRFVSLKDPYKMTVTARGYQYNMVFGEGINENYLCIPNWNIGAEIVRLDDRYWNREHIMNAYPDLNITDLDTIVESLAAAQKILERYRLGEFDEYLTVKESEKSKYRTL